MYGRARLNGRNSILMAFSHRFSCCEIINSIQTHTHPHTYLCVHKSTLSIRWNRGKNTHTDTIKWNYCFGCLGYIIAVFYTLISMYQAQCTLHIAQIPLIKAQHINYSRSAFKTLLSSLLLLLLLPNNHTLLFLFQSQGGLVDWRKLSHDN